MPLRASKAFHNDANGPRTFPILLCCRYSCNKRVHLLLSSLFDTSSKWMLQSRKARVLRAFILLSTDAKRLIRNISNVFLSFLWEHESTFWEGYNSWTLEIVPRPGP